MFLGVTIWLGEGTAFARKAVVTNHRHKEHRARSTDISRESSADTNSCAKIEIKFIDKVGIKT